MKHIRILLIIIILAFSYETFAQLNRAGTPYMRRLKVTEQGGNKQTMDVAADKNGVMYFANTSGGVLIYDGTNWNSVKHSWSIHSLCIDDETNNVYVGADNDFGVLKTNANYQYEVLSYKDKIDEQYQNIDRIFNILCSKKEGTVFQCTKYIFTIKNDSIKVISDPTSINAGFNSIYKCGERIFAVHETNGIKEVVDGELKNLPELAETGSKIKYIGQNDNGAIIIINLNKGIMEFANNELSFIDSPFNEYIRKYSSNIERILRTHDGNFVFAIRSVGLVITDCNFNIIKEMRLQGINSINRLYEDHNHLLWICSNEDVVLIDLFSPYSTYYYNETGIHGSLKSILRYGKNIYLGADAVYQTDSIENATFKELKSNKGYTAMWSLDTINGRIFGGSNKGLFTIDSLNNFINIDAVDKDRNVFKFKIPRDNPNVLIGIGLYGISTYQKTGDKWNYKVGADVGPDNFQKKSRYIEADDDGYYWVSHKDYGLYRLKLNATYDTVLSAEFFDQSKGLPSDADNYVFRADKGIVFATTDGIYKYDRESGMMVEDIRMNTIFGGKKRFDLIYYDQNGSIWVKHVVKKAKSNDNEWYLEQYILTSDSTAECISNQYNVFKDNIYAFGSVGDGKYVIGSGDRFTLYNSNISKDFFAPYKAIIRKMENIGTDSLIYGGNYTDSESLNIVLPFAMSYSSRSIRITFASAFYEYPEACKFNTYLENADEDWTGYRGENFKEYVNLWPGTYTMHVKARNIYGVESEEATLTFKILPPWYLTKLAIVIYVILFGLLIWLIIVMYTQKLIRDKQNLEKIVEERTAEIRKQSQLIMEQNKSITDSINYAKHIQRAMLPLDEKIAAVLPNHFILFRPKDIVSGDYYWFAETDKYILITAADCTGHGVPGAFMSMIGSQILTEIVGEGITSPDLILTNQNRRIRKALKQDTTENHDGMDMALCTINKETHVVEFAGAKNQLVVIKNGELTEYKADKQGIGGTQLYGDDFQYKKTSIEPDGNTWFYMFSDGYKDQFGGPDNSKFLIKRLRQLLLDIHEKSPEEQRKILDDTIQEWIDSGKGEQTDDIILMGFKL